jgi:hypothetical protein
MNKKLLFSVILVVFMIVTTFVLANNQTNSFYLRYQLNPNEIFEYNMVISTDSSDEMHTLLIKNIVYSSTNESIKMHIITKNNSNLDGTAYYKNMTYVGNILDSDYEPLAQLEIQPEIPNSLVYPEDIIHVGDTWLKKIKYSGSYSSDLGLIWYNVTGETKYSCIGSERIFVGLVPFECVNITSQSYFNLNENIDTFNGTVIVETKSEAKGYNMIDQNRGYLVKSKYDLKTVIKTDQSEIFRNLDLGLGYFSREIPIRSTIITELKR